ncbi:hypothetical protein M405DRAFT_816633 [Rhizopogon salebrosus TDB-379]|nr:hypothetical protein M405DRAFT_816633 [Rhizopogon salebrosus TDB-379]
MHSNCAHREQTKRRGDGTELSESPSPRSPSFESPYVLQASHHCPSSTPASSNILDRGVHEYFEQIDAVEHEIRAAVQHVNINRSC